MDGTGSDLRTGLPKQMIEIHEAMRLQVIVEASIEVLTRIYQRQPPLQELIGNGWLLLSAKDPTVRAFMCSHLAKASNPGVETSQRCPWWQGHPTGTAVTASH